MALSLGFSPQLDARLIEAVEEIYRKLPGPHIAAFDADGTLWKIDMGETFFQYQIDYCDLPDMPENPWQHYEDMKREDHRKAYLWLAQINKGQEFRHVQDWAKASVKNATPIPVFAAQARLIQHLKKYGFEVYIVTASVQWAVAGAAHLVNVEPDRVLGIETEIEDGIVTDRLKGEITWREGKASSLLTATGGVAPVLCVGNTIGDEALLRASVHTRLAVCSKGSVGELETSEQELQAVAQNEKWLTHQF